MSLKDWNSWRHPVGWLLVSVAALLALITITLFPIRAHADTRVQIGINVPGAVIVYDQRPRPGHWHGGNRYNGVRSVPNYVPGEVRGIPYEAGGNRWENSYMSRFQRECYIYDTWRREYLPC